MAYFIGHAGYDGLNPINAIIVVGNSDRQWLQAIHVDKKSKRLGKILNFIQTKFYKEMLKLIYLPYLN